MTEWKEYVDTKIEFSFNPYSSGLAVMTSIMKIVFTILIGFNPYSSGLAVMTIFQTSAVLPDR